MDVRNLTIGEQVKKVRKENGLSIRKFSKMLDFPENYIKKVENDEEMPCDVFFYLISVLFKVTIEHNNDECSNKKEQISPLPFTELDESVPTLGERIKQIRKIYGLSQADFAESIGASGAYISKIEKGFENASDTFLKLISCKFNVSFEYLKTGKEQAEQGASTASTMESETHDASDLINMILRAENAHDFEEVYELLDKNDEWVDTKKYVDEQFDRLKNFVVCLSCNPENGNSIGRLEESVSDMQYLFGRACFLSGLRKGLLLMQWAKGEATAKDIIL